MRENKGLVNISKSVNAIKLKELNDVPYIDDLINVIEHHTSIVGKRTAEEVFAEYRANKLFKNEPEDTRDKIIYLQEKCCNLLDEYIKAFNGFYNKEQSIEYVNTCYNVYFDVCDRLCSVLYTDMQKYEEKPVEGIDINYIYSIGGMSKPEKEIIELSIEQSKKCLDAVLPILDTHENWQYIANGLSMLSYTIYTQANKKD